MKLNSVSHIILRLFQTIKQNAEVETEKTVPDLCCHLFYTSSRTCDVKIRWLISVFDSTVCVPELQPGIKMKNIRSLQILKNIK